MNNNNNNNNAKYACMHFIHDFCDGHARAASTDALTGTIAPPAPVFLCDGTEFFLSQFHSIFQTKSSLLSGDKF
jgi:hypothetical protein